MRKTFLACVLLYTMTAVYGQTVEVIRNGGVLADGSTITVTELETAMAQNESECVSEEWYNCRRSYGT